MFKKKKLVLTIMVLCLAACVISTAIYTIIDNHRFVVIEEEIPITHLPELFEGFKILQITDLHGSYFGENQAELIKTINSLEYDMIAFTGDMSSKQIKSNPKQSIQAILDLINGIEGDAPMFWVDGNWGPSTMTEICQIFSGSLTPTGEIIKESGVTLLTQPITLIRGDDRIWVTPMLSATSFKCYQDELDLNDIAINEIKQKALENAIADYNELKNNGEVKILLHHYPFPTNLSDLQIEALDHLDYNLILAGHYHGGQIRLPLIGALFVPSNRTGIGNTGLFPRQSDVKGMNYFGSVPQYISAGLGSSNILPLLNFRLFNTPEINIITLIQSSED